MALKPNMIFVVTYGRTGSTLLMGILNTVRGARITGENGNVLAHLFRAIKMAKYGKKKFGRYKTTPEHAWYGAEDYNLKAFKKKLIAAFKTDILGATGLESVLGFKEIRSGAMHFSDDEFLQYIEFLLTEFPRSIIVINTRDLESTAQSAWHATWPDALNILKPSDVRVRSILKHFPERTLHIHYDDYVKNHSVLIEAFAKFGIKIDPKKMANAMTRTHSSAKDKVVARVRTKRSSRASRALKAIRSQLS
jgi:hypothetical protein